MEMDDSNIIEEKLKLVTVLNNKKYTMIDSLLTDEIIYRNKLIKINVGGKVFTSKLSVLLSYKDSLFYIYFGSLLEAGKNLPDEIFIDRNYHYFQYILNYLRYRNIITSQLTKEEKAELRLELDYYGVELTANEKEEYEIIWDQINSTPGVFKISKDNKYISIFGVTCYTHYVTDRWFTDENFRVEFTVTIEESNEYFYFGIFNEEYITASNCSCSPDNACFIICDGSVYVDSRKQGEAFKFNQTYFPYIIGMTVILSEKKIWFYKDSPENSFGPYTFTLGNFFKVFCGSCSSCVGNVRINSCYAI